MALTPWYKIATLRKAVREGRSFSPARFANAPTPPYAWATSRKANSSPSVSPLASHSSSAASR